MGGQVWNNDGVPKIWLKPWIMVKYELPPVYLTMITFHLSHVISPLDLVLFPFRTISSDPDPTYPGLSTKKKRALEGAYAVTTWFGHTCLDLHDTSRVKFFLLVPKGSSPSQLKVRTSSRHRLHSWYRCGNSFSPYDCKLAIWAQGIHTYFMYRSQMFNYVISDYFSSSFLCKQIR